MERTFSGIKDVDRKILEKLDDKDLLSILLTNKYLNKILDERFWRNRLIQRYPGAISFKKEEKEEGAGHTQTWKRYYLTTVYYVNKLKREFNYDYISGDPEFYYQMVSHIESLMNPNKSSGARRTMLLSKLIRLGYDDLGLYLENRTVREFGRRYTDYTPEEWASRKAFIISLDYPDEE